MHFLSRKKQAPASIQVPPASSTNTKLDDSQKPNDDSIGVTRISLPPSTDHRPGGPSGYGTYLPEEPVVTKQDTAEATFQQQQQPHYRDVALQQQQHYDSYQPEQSTYGYATSQPQHQIHKSMFHPSHPSKGASSQLSSVNTSLQDLRTQELSGSEPVGRPTGSQAQYASGQSSNHNLYRQPPSSTSEASSRSEYGRDVVPTLSKQQQLAKATQDPSYRDRQYSFESLGSEREEEQQVPADENEVMEEDYEEYTTSGDNDSMSQRADLLHDIQLPHSSAILSSHKASHEVPLHSTLTSSPAISMTSSVRRTTSRYTFTDFQFMRTLGTGSFGRVHLVRSCHNSRFYAIKVLRKDKVVKMKQVEHTNSEREMLERVRHPFLVNLWGTFKDSYNLYMVMDFVSGGELFTLLRKSQRLPDPVAKFFAAEVALALDYLHSHDIVYRDLKPENILLAADGHIKITDFGFAKHVPDITWTLCGTPDYLAPEIVQSRPYNKSVDWWALGVLIFEMVAGYPPFFSEDPNPMKLYEKIIIGKVRYPPYFTIEVKDLLKHLLTSDLTKRYGNLKDGSGDIFGHLWFAEVDWERLYRKEIPAPFVPRLTGDGDTSCFENYDEVDVFGEYGRAGPDPHGFVNFFRVLGQ